jgi:hypothetical protein
MSKLDELQKLCEEVGYKTAMLDLKDILCKQEDEKYRDAEDVYELSEEIGYRKAVIDGLRGLEKKVCEKYGASMDLIADEEEE